MELHALLQALRFDRPPSEQLPDLSRSQWQRLLDIADREHLTLALGVRCPAGLPEWVRARIDANLEANAERLRRIRETYLQAAFALEGAGIEFAVLKGFSHSCGYVLDPRHRPQYDLDLLVERSDLERARDVLSRLGYEPITGLERMPLDHLPPMIRKTGWRWRGDYFDIDIPLTIELHFRLWDPDTERIRLDGTAAFWARRVHCSVEGLSFPALAPQDRLAYAAMHLMRHIFRGDFRLYHAYELAHFLDSAHTGQEFWSAWQRTQSALLRRLMAIAFSISARWFGGVLPAAVQQEAEALPVPVRVWFDLFAQAPVESKIHPNKNELWLHWALLDSRTDRWASAVRRLLPSVHHPARYAPHVPAAQAGWRLRFARRLFQVRFALGRLAHHLRATAPTIAGGLRWWMASQGLQAQFLRFLGAASLFNFGLSIFFLLYNLFLLQLGFHEDFIGIVASAMGAGSIAGALPSAYVLHRFGIRATLIATFIAVPLVCAARVVSSSPALLIASAFCGGLLFSAYAIALAPTVARLTTSRSRPFGFSLVFSLGIGSGVIAGVAGGRLPGLLAARETAGPASLQYALLTACAIAALAALPVLRLRLEPAEASQRTVYPRSRFIVRFLLAVLIWNLATGAFNPFFNTYFAQVLHTPVSTIGVFFSGAQLVQVIAVLSAPLVIRRFGPVRGVMSMQLAAAGMLALFATGPAGLAAGSIYAGYMGFQYMSEPGMFTVLMDGVVPADRTGASALNFLVMAGIQALAAAFAGFGVRTFGYPAVLAAAALMAVLAAFSFRALGGKQSLRPAQTAAAMLAGRTRVR